MLRISGAGTDSCSLGPHCEVLPLRGDDDAYRRAHPRHSATSDTTTRTGPATAAPWHPPGERTVLDAIADAMDRLDRINPPPPEGPLGR